MSQRVLISGSIAYDTIMVFEGHFKDHILPDKVHMINVSFLAPTLERSFGGCAANIAYSLKGLGGEPLMLATVGRDADDYLRRFASLAIDTTHVAQLASHYTAQCFITTDLADNQITAFHPGAMTEAHCVPVPTDAAAVLGIVSPNGKTAMLRHAVQFREAGIPFVFDPGQGLPMFDGEELRGLIDGATAVTVNDYEGSMLCERTGWSEARIAERVEALIITRGAEGSDVWTRDGRERVAPCPVTRAVDPTGCGDAYRAGLLHGRSLGWDWIRSARLGSVMGALKIESQGPQNHTIDLEAIARRFDACYGLRPW
ncbi:MAG: hypothetical protein RIS35_2498 [Pseudomonadota bacterium]